MSSSCHRLRRGRHAGLGTLAIRRLPYIADIGTLMAHRSVGGYTLSMSHFFDLTGPSFAALRLPAILAPVAFFLGPLAAWRLRRGACFRIHR